VSWHSAFLFYFAFSVNISEWSDHRPALVDHSEFLSKKQNFDITAWRVNHTFLSWEKQGQLNRIMFFLKADQAVNSHLGQNILLASILLYFLVKKRYMLYQFI